MTQVAIQFHAQPAQSVRGELQVPGDKSISHRSIMLGALAEGVTRVSHFLQGEDSLATLQAFRDMGVNIEGPDEKGDVTIHGVGMHGLKKPNKELYLGNSGTSMRLLTGLLAGQNFDCVLTGDESLSNRPMKRVAAPLALMGAAIKLEENSVPPIHISGGKKLQGIEYSMPMASAQVKSCVLLAGLFSEGVTSVIEPAPTRDHTERMLKGFGYAVEREDNVVRLQGGGKLTACEITVPSDISSAAFFLVAATIAKNSKILLKQVGINPTRTGVIDILKLMGADIQLENQQEIGGEPVADLRVRSANLQGINIPENLVPLAIDEFPAIFIAAACAEGVTRLTGAEELRVKESDRIQVMADGLTLLGIANTVFPDGIVIEGQGIKTEFNGAQINSHGDHRIAMAFAMASLRATKEIIIEDCANVATSFPGFVELANGVGLEIERKF